MRSLPRRTVAVGRRVIGSAGARTYVPLVVELVGLAVAAVALVALIALTLVSQAAIALLAVPTGAGVWNWARRWSPPRSQWRVHADARRRCIDLLDAIDRAPHRHARRARHDLYGVFVERVGPSVSVALVRRRPGPRRGRVERTSVAEERCFAGDEVEAAAGWLAQLEERAAAAEQHERDRLAAERDAAERARLRARRAAEDARLRTIEATHESELAQREAALRQEDERAREREAQLEAEALARALRRS